MAEPFTSMLTDLVNGIDGSIGAAFIDNYGEAVQSFTAPGQDDEYLKLMGAYQGIAFAAGFDHIVYGWIFFALVMGAVLGGAWRFFDRSPDDAPISASAINASPLMARLDSFRAGGWLVLAAIVGCIGAAAWMDRFVLVP